MRIINKLLFPSAHSNLAVQGDSTKLSDLLTRYEKGETTLRQQVIDQFTVLHGQMYEAVNSRKKLSRDTIIGYNQLVHRLQTMNLIHPNAQSLTLSGEWSNPAATARLHAVNSDDEQRKELFLKELFKNRESNEHRLNDLASPIDGSFEEAGRLYQEVGNLSEAVITELDSSNTNPTNSNALLKFVTSISTLSGPLVPDDEKKRRLDNADRLLEKSGERMREATSKLDRGRQQLAAWEIALIRSEIDEMRIAFASPLVRSRALNYSQFLGQYDAIKKPTDKLLNVMEEVLWHKLLDFKLLNTEEKEELLHTAVDICKQLPKALPSDVEYKKAAIETLKWAVSFLEGAINKPGEDGITDGRGWKKLINKHSHLPIKIGSLLT